MQELALLKQQMSDSEKKSLLLQLEKERKLLKKELELSAKETEIAKLRLEIIKLVNDKEVAVIRSETAELVKDQQLTMLQTQRAEELIAIHEELEALKVENLLLKRDAGIAMCNAQVADGSGK